MAPTPRPAGPALHPGVVSYASEPAQTIISGTGSAAISSAIDPIAGQGACATVSGADQGTGVASYRLPAATGNGYTLLGAPVITASLAPTGTYPIIAGGCGTSIPTTGTETLVARGLYRVATGGVQTFQLHPGAWHFAAGHIPKLELLSQDAPYGRTSNGQFSIAVSKLSLTLPVHDVPGAPGTPPEVTPPGGDGAICLARPAARITRHRVDRRHRLILAGRASERPLCPRQRTGAALAADPGRAREHLAPVGPRPLPLRHLGRPPLAPALVPPGAVRCARAEPRAGR